MEIRRRNLTLLSVLVITLFYCVHLRWEYVSSLQTTRRHGLKGEEVYPANSTLGFGAIYAVSKPASHRRDSLLYAANLTGLSITVPKQPRWTSGQISGFRSPVNSRVSPGSLLAWLGHLNALRAFLATPHSTALIIEDDVDWDIHLRLSQIPLAARTLSHLHGTPDPSLYPHSSHHAQQYWSNTSAWEILYLGHCGDSFPPLRFSSLSSQVYTDPSVPPMSNLAPQTSSFLNSIGLHTGQRILHRSVQPLCTFGYAVTRASAQRILDTYANEGPDGCHAYDVRILESCRDHDWKCLSVNPELMHHVNGARSEIGEIDSPSRAAGGASPGSAGGRDYEFGRKETHMPVSMGQRVNDDIPTPNIRCGARSEKWRTSDPKALRMLKDVVGNKGHCIKDWRAPRDVD